jgi:hypothetical protein
MATSIGRLGGRFQSGPKFGAGALASNFRLVRGRHFPMTCRRCSLRTVTASTQ